MIPGDNLQSANTKIKQYCTFQERSHYEVIKKLYSYGLYKKDVDVITTHLIEENYLNEERFAVQFAGGKFRIKHWGRVKIKMGLQQHKISTYNIKTALYSINNTDYEHTLEKLAAKKWKTLKSDAMLFRKQKTQNFLLQKGFEKNLIILVVNKLTVK